MLRPMRDAGLPCVCPECGESDTRRLLSLIAAPVHRMSKARGHPVGFSRKLFAELEKLDGDEGARSVILRHGADISLIVVDDAGITRDIDTPSDLPP